MNAFPSKLKNQKNAGRTYLVLTVGIMAVVLMVVFYLYHQTQTSITPPRPEFDTTQCVRLLDISRVYRITTDPFDASRLWFSTAEGIRVFDSETAEWIRYGLDHGLPDEVISDITFRGRIPWVGTWSGIAIFDSTLGSFRKLDPQDGRYEGRVLSVEAFGSDSVFFSVDGKGLFLAIDESSVIPVDLPSIPRDKRITSLSALGSDLYAGVEDRRLFSLSASGSWTEIGFASSSRESPQTLIWDVMKHNGKVWVTTSDDGIYVKDEGADSLRQVKEFPAKGAYSFAEEEDGFWCGTPFGLWRYHDQGEVWIQFVHPDQEEPTDFQVFALAGTPHEIWYGSMDLGAGYLTKRNVQWHRMRAGLTHPNVAAIGATDSIFWTGYGYQAGFVDRFFTDDVQYDRNFGLASGLGDDHIQTFEIFKDRLYYGGYEGFGYVPLNGHRFRHFAKKSGLPHSDIAAIHATDSVVWLGSLFGVIEFAPHSNTFSRIASTEPNRITALHRSGDSLWIGTLGHGVMLLNLSTGNIVGRFINSARRITALLPVTSSGPHRIWVITESSGVHEIDPTTENIRQIRIPTNVLRGDFGEIPNTIAAAAKINERIWLGLEESGCLVYNMNTGRWSRFTHLDGLVSDRIRAIASSDSYVFIGSYGGLARIDHRYIDEAGL